MADIKAIITAAAARYGIDPDVALRIGTIESGLDPNAHNKVSSAGGLFQFIDTTWADYGKGKNKMDPEASADAAMRLLRDNSAVLERGLGRPPTGGELYLAHQQGAGGALALLKNPSGAASETVGGDAVINNGGHSGMTSGDFAALWTSKFDTTTPPATALYTGAGTAASMGGMETSAYTVDQPTRVPYEAVTSAQAPSDTPDYGPQIPAPEAPGLLRGMSIAIQNEWSIASPWQAVAGAEPDDNFHITPALIQEHASFVPNEYLGDLSEAVSKEHFVAIADNIHRRMGMNDELTRMGTTGTVLALGASLTDPGAWAATAAIAAATDGLGIGPAVAANFGRAGMVGLSATEGVVGNLATDVPLVMADPTRDAASLKWSIGAGLVLGGAFGVMRKSPGLTAEADALHAVGKKMQAEAQSVLDRNDGVGANRVGAPDWKMTSDAHELTAIYTDLAKNTELVYGKVRFDQTAEMMSSKNPMMKVLGNLMWEDPVRKSNASGLVTPIAVSEVQHRLFRVSQYKWAKGFGDAWDSYANDTGTRFMTRKKDLSTFKADVASFIRETDPSKTANYHPAVVKAGTTFNTEMKGWWKRAEEAGLTRTEMGVENYFPRYPHLTEAALRIHRYGVGRDLDNGGVASLFREAIIKRQPDIDPKLAHSMGYAIADRFGKMNAGENMLESGRLGFDLGDIEEVLGDHLSADEMDMAKAYLTRNTSPEGGGPARLKSRINLDENFSAKLRNKETGLDEEVNISDFYISDPNLVLNMYARQMSGSVALAGLKVTDHVTGGLLIDGIKSPSDWAKLKKQVVTVGAETGAHTERDLEALDFFHSAMTGTPFGGRNESGSGETALRMLRDVQFTRLMGQVGFSQVQEVGKITSKVGLKMAMRAFPGFRAMIKEVRTGNLSDELAEELVSMSAAGKDFSRVRFHIEADEFGSPLSMGSGTAMQKTSNAISPVLHKGNRLVTVFSGLAGINSLLQTLTSRSFAMKFTDMALGGKAFTPERLRALGISEEIMTKIKGEINAHAQFKGGQRVSHKLDALGIAKWHPETRAAFENSMYRALRSTILENDPGQFARWMSSPLGKTATQFRNFTIGAYSKATLQGINMKDMDAAVGFLTTSFLGALAYVGQTHLNLIGDADAETKREERLSWDRIALAGFMKSSESSLTTIPADMVYTVLKGEPLFDMRSSGLKAQATNAFTSNPSLDFIGRAAKAVGDGVSSALSSEDDYTKAEMQNATSLLPFQRLIGVSNLFNFMAQDLPE